MVRLDVPSESQRFRGDPVLSVVAPLYNESENVRPLVEWKWRLYRGHNRRKPSSVPYDGGNSADGGANPGLKKSA